jgi:glyoxylase-like metal-dependent hydrolase (beta-lactamase superfamily II)
VIHALAVPTPFAVGRVNCWLVEDEPLTLVDTGPNSATSLEALENALGDRGRRVEDLERIVVTHQHMDHIGLAALLVRRSGAEVCALDRLAPWLEHYSASMRGDDAFAQAVMRRNGVPEELVLALVALTTGFRAWGAAAQVTQRLRDGGELGFAGRTWRVWHRPGHSPSDTVFHDERSGDLVGGDHLLAQVSSNPLVSRPLGEAGDAAHRPRALMAYLDSLRATRGMEVRRVLPGHGEVISDHVALIDERLRLHERRARKLERLIAAEPRTAFALARAMWGSAALTQAYLTLSEVLGHVDLLLDRGSVVEEELDDGVVRYRAAG